MYILKKVWHFFRFKNVELNEELKEKLRQERASKIQEHRAEILRLWVSSLDDDR